MTIVLPVTPSAPAPGDTAPYEAFLPEVLPFVQDVPEPTAIRAIRAACIEFCEKTMYWLYECDPIAVEGGTSTYNIPVPVGTVPGRIMEAYLGNQPLEPSSEELLRERYKPYDWRNVEGQPYYITLIRPSDVTLTPFPLTDLTEQLNVIVSLRPAQSSTTVGYDIYERYMEQIAYGARARLYDMAGQSFYNPQQAIAYRQKFINAMGEGKIERNRGITRVPLVVRPPTI